MRECTSPRKRGMNEEGQVSAVWHCKSLSEIDDPYHPMRALVLCRGAMRNGVIWNYFRADHCDNAALFRCCYGLFQRLRAESGDFPSGSSGSHTYFFSDPERRDLCFPGSACAENRWQAVHGVS